MNGRVAKKIRKVAEVNVYHTYVGLIQSLMGMDWRKRLKFCYCVLFKRQYVPGKKKEEKVEKQPALILSFQESTGDGQ